MEVNVNIKKEIIRDFLQYLFPDSDDETVIVSHSSSAGKFICTQVSYCDRPLEQQGNIRMQLPICPALQTGPRRFLYFSPEAEVRINDYLEIAFDLDFDRYWLEGQKLGMKQQDIITAYIVSRKLVSREADHEMLKKRMYRQSMKTMHSRRESLLNRAKYKDRQFRETLPDEKKIF